MQGLMMSGLPEIALCLSIYMQIVSAEQEDTQSFLSLRSQIYPTKKLQALFGIFFFSKYCFYICWFWDVSNMCYVMEKQIF